MRFSTFLAMICFLTLTVSSIQGESLVSKEFEVTADKLTKLSARISYLAEDSSTNNPDFDEEEFLNYIEDFDASLQRGEAVQTSYEAETQKWLLSTEWAIKELEQIVEEYNESISLLTKVRTERHGDLEIFEYPDREYVIVAGSPHLWRTLFLRISHGAVSALAKKDYREAMHLLELGWAVNSAAIKHVVGHESFRVAVPRQSRMMTIWLLLPVKLQGDNLLDTSLVKPGLKFLADSHRYDCQLEIKTDPIIAKQSQRHLAALNIELKGLPDDDNQLLAELYKQLTDCEGQPDYEGIGVPAIPVTMGCRRAFNLDRLTMRVLQIINNQQSEQTAHEKLMNLKHSASQLNIAAVIEWDFTTNGHLKNVKVSLPKMELAGVPNGRLLGMEVAREFPTFRQVK